VVVMVVLSHSCGSLWKNHHVFVRKLKRRHLLILLTTISSLITWSKPSFLLDAALQHCWALASRHVKMLRCGKILSVGGKIVANMLPTCYRIVGVSSVSGVPNMLATCWQQCSLKWSLALQMRFLGSKYARNAFAAGAGELTALPRPPSWI